MMKPIDENTPKDRELLLWSPFRGGMLGEGRWDDDRYAARGPRPFWDIRVLRMMWGKSAMRANQPTHWCEKPTSPDQVTVIRDEPNAYGIPTKLRPSMRDDAFLTDNDEDWMRPVLYSAQAHLIKSMRDGHTVAWPTNGIGTGLAQLAQRAPSVYAIIKEVERQLWAYGKDSEQ